MGETNQSDEVKAILQKWNLEHLNQIFIDNSIDYEAFCLLTDDNINEIIPKLGDRIKFAAKHKIFKLELNPPTVITVSNSEPTAAITTATVNDIIFDISPSPSTSSITSDDYCSENINLDLLKDFVNDTALENVPVPYKRQNAFCVKNLEELYNNTEPTTYHFDLKAFLQGSSEGREILQSKDSLTPALRNKLSDIIIRNELKSDESVITTGRFIQLARLIKQLFPTETISTYYTPYRTDEAGKYKRCARGKLFDKYHNRRRTLRAAGLLSSRRKKVAEFAKDEENSFSNNEEQLENISWLQHCIEPWTDVVDRWNETFEHRKSLLTRINTVQPYFDQYPALKQPLGYTLIELDYKREFQQYENKLFSSFPTLSLKILAKVKKSKDQNIIKLWEANKDLENEDHSMALSLICLPYLFSKTVLIRPKSNKKVQWRPSKLEVQQAFIVHLKTATEVQPFLERRSKKYSDLQETCQPVVIIIGESLREYEVLLSINNLIYKPGNLLKSLDVIFKIFHVLHLKYPAECEHVWHFIQKTVYNMKTAWDKTFIVVEQLISDLDQEIVHSG